MFFERSRKELKKEIWRYKNYPSIISPKNLKPEFIPKSILKKPKNIQYNLSDNKLKQK
jgi:hypothetical protein